MYSCIDVHIFRVKPFIACVDTPKISAKPLVLGRVSSTRGREVHLEPGVDGAEVPLAHLQCRVTSSFRGGATFQEGDVFFWGGGAALGFRVQARRAGCGLGRVRVRGGALGFRLQVLKMTGVWFRV